MTLIELMVVVVILVTLVGGVLPLVSPNNDARKIAEASRGLQTYFMQAQAEAARIGRPVGVGFRETAAESGVAVEVFQLTVPKPYVGSSTQSRMGVQALTTIVSGNTVPDTYGGKNTPPPVAKEELRFEEYRGAQLYAVDSKMALLDPAGNKVADPLPPKMFRVGDKIFAQGNEFVIVDDFRLREITEKGSLTRFVNPATNPDQKDLHKLFCVRLADVQMGNDSQPLSVPDTGYSYGIHRQPMADSANRMNSSEAPFQLPSGIGIDLMSTGLEAGEMETIYESSRLSDKPIGGNPLPYTVGIMFSPNGGIESVWINGKKSTEVSRVFFLLGRAENGEPQADLYTDWGGRGQTKEISDEEFKDRQSKVNWLSLDSRWLMVNGSDGRLTVAANALVDPRHRPELIPAGVPFGPKYALASRELQIEAAHELAHQHASGGDRNQ